MKDVTALFIFSSVLLAIFALVYRGGFGGVKVHYSGTPNIQKHFYKKDHGQKVASERMEEGV